MSWKSFALGAVAMLGLLYLLNPTAIAVTVMGIGKTVRR
jgi:hypothetical protein